jgi:hypothetical protein
MTAIDILDILAKRPNSCKVLFEAKGIRHQLEGFENVEKCFAFYSKFNPDCEVKFIIDGKDYEINGYEIPDKSYLSEYKLIFKNG